MPTNPSAGPGALFQFLLRLHPTVGPVVAAVVFVALRLGVPYALTPAGGQVDPQSVAAVVVAVSQKAAVPLTAAIFFVWAFTLLHRLFDRQSPPAP